MPKTRSEATAKRTERCIAQAVREWKDEEAPIVKDQLFAAALLSAQSTDECDAWTEAVAKAGYPDSPSFNIAPGITLTVSIETVARHYVEYFESKLDAMVRLETSRWRKRWPSITDSHVKELGDRVKSVAVPKLATSALHGFRALLLEPGGMYLGARWLIDVARTAAWARHGIDREWRDPQNPRVVLIERDTARRLSDPAPHLSPILHGHLPGRLANAHKDGLRETLDHYIDDALTLIPHETGRRSGAKDRPGSSKRRNETKATRSAYLRRLRDYYETSDLAEVTRALREDRDRRKLASVAAEIAPKLGKSPKAVAEYLRRWLDSLRSKKSHTKTRH